MLQTWETPRKYNWWDIASGTHSSVGEFHRAIKNNMIDRLHEQWLKIIYNEENWTFEESVEKYEFVTNHKQ